MLLEGATAHARSDGQGRHDRGRPRPGRGYNQPTNEAKNKVT